MGSKKGREFINSKPDIDAKLLFFLHNYKKKGNKNRYQIICACHVSGKPDHGVVYSIQHYVIKFVRDLRHVFIWVLRFPPPRYTEILFKVVLNNKSKVTKHQSQNRLCLREEYSVFSAKSMKNEMMCIKKM